MASTAINILDGLVKKVGAILPGSNTSKGMSWFTVRKLKHLSTGPERTFIYEGKAIHYVNPYDLYLAFEEIFDHEIYKMPLPSKALIFDCGANIGLATLYLKLLNPDCRIIAFEPDEKNFALLQKNMESWQFREVEMRKQAVWTAQTQLQFSSTGDMASKISTGNQGITVDAIRLRDMMTERIHFLKLDIEGAEFEVLKDIQDHLHLVDRMFFEYHGRFEDTGNLTQVFEILHQSGFRYYIKEAANVYGQPFSIQNRAPHFDVQLNIFCFRDTLTKKTP